MRRRRDQTTTHLGAHLGGALGKSGGPVLRTDLLVVDVETNGLPRDGFSPSIVEVGLCVVTRDLRIVSPVSFLVNPGEEALECEQAAEAFRVTGLDPNEIRLKGIPTEEAAARLLAWLGRARVRFNLEEVRAYNDAFDLGLLELPPWRLLAEGELRIGPDPMKASAAIMGRAGALPPAPPWTGERWKNPRLTEAVAWWNAQGAAVAWTGGAHRAREDALQAAAIVVAIEKHNRGIPLEEHNR